MLFFEQYLAFHMHTIKFLLSFAANINVGIPCFIFHGSSSLSYNPFSLKWNKFINFTLTGIKCQKC